MGAGNAVNVLFRWNWLLPLTILLANSGTPCASASAAAGERLVRATGQNPQHQVPQSGKGDLTIAVAVDLVTIDVSVTGNPKGDLQAGDFLVYDDGVVQRLTHFSRDQLPLSVALVVDLSGSIQPYLGDLKDKARSALDTLKPEDRVTLFGFATFASQLTELTRDASRISDLLGGLRSGGSTNICDAIFIAARHLRNNARGQRKAIILISDNCHNITWGQTWGSARQELLESGATLWGIQIRGTGFCAQELAHAREIAEDTGGGMFEAGGLFDGFTGRSLTRLLAQTVANLRTQYTLGFTPSNAKPDGSFHRLRVALRDGAPCPKCRLAARTGYYAGTPPSSPPVALNRPADSRVQRVDADVYNRITLAAADLTEWQEIPFECRYANEEESPGWQQLRIQLQIDVSGIEFQTVDGRHAARFYLGVFFGWPNGPYSTAHWRIVDLQLKEEAYVKMMSDGVPVSFPVPSAARGAVFKVVICDAQNKQVGSRRFVIQ